VRRGIVVAEGRRGAIVLTPEGEFVEVPGRPAAVGEEIGFEPPKRRTASRRRLLFAASAAVFLLLAAAGLTRLAFFGGPEVAAYVAIDINPSVEIGVDRHRAAVELRALNADGERVIEGIDYRKRPVGEVAADIIRSAEAAEYLRDGGEVFVTSMAAVDIDERFEEELVREIGQAVQASAPRSGERPDKDEAGNDVPGSASGASGDKGCAAGSESGPASESGNGSGSAAGQTGSTGASAGNGSTGGSAQTGSAGAGHFGPEGAAGRSGPDGAASPAGSDGVSAKPGAGGTSSSSGDAVRRKDAESASGSGVTVTIVRAPGKLRETARANGVSPGKMAIYLLAEKRGIPISLNDLKQRSIHEAVEPYGGISALLGDGRSDEDRKRELAELLEQEADKNAAAKDGAAKAAEGKAKSADNGEKASANGGDKSTASGAKQASADGNKPAAADAGKNPSSGSGKKSSGGNGKNATGGNGKPPGARKAAGTGQGGPERATGAVPSANRGQAANAWHSSDAKRPGAAIRAKPAASSRQAADAKRQT